MWDIVVAAWPCMLRCAECLLMPPAAVVMDRFWVHGIPVELLLSQINRKSWALMHTRSLLARSGFPMDGCSEELRCSLDEPDWVSEHYRQIQQSKGQTFMIKVYFENSQSS